MPSVQRAITRETTGSTVLGILRESAKTAHAVVSLAGTFMIDGSEWRYIVPPVVFGTIGGIADTARVSGITMGLGAGLAMDAALVGVDMLRARKIDAQFDEMMAGLFRH